MGRRYGQELSRLSETFEWAAKADLEPLRHAVRTAGVGPLYAVGSGGSLTGAHALAYLHQRFTDTVATVATPLDVADTTHLDAATWLLSAGGSNGDIIAAAQALISREPRQLSVLCGGESSPLAELCRRHPFVDLLLYPPPFGRDGFLATNSLFGFVALLTRTYATEFGVQDDWQESVTLLQSLLHDDAVRVEAWRAETVSLGKRPTTLVLYGPQTRIGAIDLESKFTEAALGHVKIADYRNFAHGRHHWLAKRRDKSAVLAFITNSDRSLAERTLDLIPNDIPKAKLHFEGGPCSTSLGSLLAALHITEWAGHQVGIDPGRPGVPAFGRRLYHLALKRPKDTRDKLQLSGREAAAIKRKARVDVNTLAASGELECWRDALNAFLARIRATHFAGVVLDYDGTLVDTRQRAAPATEAMAAELIRLSQLGTYLAVATGRGASVRRDLQKCLPRSLWSLILVGYYNGAEIAYLDNDDAPDGSTQVCAALHSVAAELRGQPALAGSVRQEDRSYQITLTPVRPMGTDRLWELVCGAIARTGVRDVEITRSSHSIDILASGVSKLNVVQRMRARTGDSPILAIGDRGRWPGNDYALLRESFSLGVDEVSADPDTCWNVGAPGQRGTAVTLDYLSSLQERDGQVHFAPDSFR